MRHHVTIPPRQNTRWRQSPAVLPLRIALHAQWYTRSQRRRSAAWTRTTGLSFFIEFRQGQWFANRQSHISSKFKLFMKSVSDSTNNSSSLIWLRSSSRCLTASMIARHDYTHTTTCSLGRIFVDRSDDYDSHRISTGCYCHSSLSKSYAAVAHHWSN